jgi:acyl-CoA thioesterase I
LDKSSLIICFGDSLTAGFQSPTRENPEGRSTPYGAWLEQSLGPAVQVHITGICGELTGEMVLRFKRDVLDHRPAYATLLGGTNDLAWNAQPREIMRNLVKMYELTLAAGAVPIPVTVPSIRAEEGQTGAEGQGWIADHLTRRHLLNGLIRDYATSKTIAYVDLFHATADPETHQLAAMYSNDGVHLTTAGYRRMAEEVVKVLKRMLTPTR